MKSLKKYFGLGQSTSHRNYQRNARKRKSGNRSLPSELQKEIKAKAEAKRLRKMARPRGWYNG